MRRTVVLTLAAALPLLGCIEDPTPHRARLTMQGETGKTVRLLVARDFIAGVNEQGAGRIVIIKADTINATLPFQAEYNIEEAQQLFAETTRLDSAVQNFRMQVYIDGKLRFDESGLLADQRFRFIYIFNVNIPRDVTVVI